LWGVLLWGVLSWGVLKKSSGGRPKHERRGADLTSDDRYSTARARDDRRPNGPWADGIGADAPPWGNRCSVGGWWGDRSVHGLRGGERWWAGASPPPGSRFDQPRDEVSGWWRPEVAPAGIRHRADPGAGDPTPWPRRAGAPSGFVPAQGVRCRSFRQDGGRGRAPAPRMRLPVQEPGGEAVGHPNRAPMALFPWPAGRRP